MPCTKILYANCQNNRSCLLCIDWLLPFVYRNWKIVRKKITVNSFVLWSWNVQCQRHFVAFVEMMTTKKKWNAQKLVQSVDLKMKKKRSFRSVDVTERIDTIVLRVVKWFSLCGNTESVVCLNRLSCCCTHVLSIHCIQAEWLNGDRNL